VLIQLPQEKPFAQLCYVKQLGQLIYPEQAIAAALKMLRYALLWLRNYNTII
jgi:hypothetical protein